MTCAAVCVARINPAEMIAILSMDRIGFLLIVSPSRAGVDIVYANYNARGHPGGVTATPPPTAEDRLVDLTAATPSQVRRASPRPRGAPATRRDSDLMQSNQ